MNHHVLHALAHLAKEGILKIQENLNCHACDHTNFGDWYRYGCCHLWMCSGCKRETIRCGRCARCGNEARYQ